MATKIPRVIADLELQLATALSVGGESFTLSSATDDDGVALPAGIYVFAVDSGTSNKEYLLGQLNDSEVTAVKSVSRQGVQTTGAARAHRVGAPVILTNFAALQLVADTLRGAVDLDAGNPLSYDAAPTLSDNNELATVGYVLATVTGGNVSFDKQTIAGNAGATIAAGDLVYFDEADQEWKLCDADTAATVEGVMRGIALGSGTDGAAITGGVHLAGAWTTTGLTAGAIYYASNTAGDLATTAGTVKHIVGVALSTTRLWVIPQHRETIPTRTKDALAGGGDLGTPSTSNKFLTEDITEGTGDVVRKSLLGVVTAGTTTRAANAGAGTVTVAHGLGAAPKYVKLSAVFSRDNTLSNAHQYAQSFGFANATNNYCVASREGSRDAGSSGGDYYVDTLNSDTYSIYIDTGASGDSSFSHYQRAVVTFDATNITFTWTNATAEVSTTIKILWEAYLS